MLRSQSIAVATLQKIEEVAGRDAEFQQRYSTLVNRLPVMVRENGLVASMGFLEGKGEADGPEGMLSQHLASQLGYAKQGLHTVARSASLKEYRHLTQRVMELLVWYKRLSESKLDTEGGENNGN